MTTPTSKQKGTPFNKGASLPPSSSSTATQHPSSGSLLAIIQSEHQSIVTNIPIVGFVASFFINRSIRKDYIDAIKGQFFEGAIKNKISLKDTSSIFNTHFLPFLSECNLEDLLLLEPILADPAGVDLVLQNLTPEPKPYLRNAFATLPIVNRLIGRLRPVDLRNYLKVWIQDAKALSNENFRTLVGGFTAHLAYAESLQSSRPHIFDQNSPEAIKLKAGFSNLLQQSEIAVQAQKLAPFSSVIRDMTIIDNRQILMASIASLYLGDTFKGDSLVPELVPRSVGTRGAPPFSLFNQIGTPLSLPEGPSWTILENFKLFTEIYITDPLSMETRRIRVPLPIPGRTTLGEVNKQLEILKRVVNDPDQFDDACAQLGLVEVKEALREPFIEFSEQWGEALGQALGDFNSTATRPKESTARAQPENAASIAHPNSKGYAVESAKMHNLFLLQDGTLSLIPSGPGEKHRGIGSLSQDELSDAAALLFGKQDKPVPFLVPEGASDDTPLRQAELSLQVSEKMIDEEIPFLIVETAITLDGKTTLRKSYYERRVIKRVDEAATFESIEDVKTRILDSGLFERDLLLAKAAFIEQHAANLFNVAKKRNPEGAQWVQDHAARVGLLMGNRFSNADQTQYINSMLEIACDMPPNDFKKLSQMLDNIASTALSIQAERPTVYDGVKKIDFVKLFYDPEIVKIMTQYPFLADIYKTEICEMTVLMNTQKIHENVAMYFTEPTSINRMFSNLTPFHKRSTALSVEKHTPFQLYEDSDAIIDFYAGIDLYVTTEKTMETRHLHAAFPFEGKMTPTEARSLLELLDSTIAAPRRFDANYKNLKLDPSLQSERKAIFLTWVEKIEQEYAKLIFDFNPTPTRPTMSYALETKESQAAIEQPQDALAAIQVAKAKNIYLIDGKLSLLPKPVAQFHAQIAMIAPHELSESTQLLLGEKTETIPIAITPQLTAFVSFETKPKKFSEIQAIQLETTFEGEGKALTRTTLYLLEPGQTPTEKLNEIIASDLFERDLLLAKAEFIGEDGKL